MNVSGKMLSMLYTLVTNNSLYVRPTPVLQLILVLLLATILSCLTILHVYQSNSNVNMYSFLVMDVHFIFISVLSFVAVFVLKCKPGKTV